MGTINDLLKELDNKVPASIAKRLDGLNKLNEKLSIAREENSTNPTEESQEQLDEIIEFIRDTQDDLREDLSELVAKKREADVKARQNAKIKAELEAKKIAEEKYLKAKEKDKFEQEELKQKELSEKESLEATVKSKTEKESGIGWGSLVVGGALLILSAGAINYFGKKR